MAVPRHLALVERFRREVPHAQIIVLLDAYHYFFIGEMESVAREMDAFLAGSAGRRP